MRVPFHGREINTKHVYYVLYIQGLITDEDELSFHGLFFTIVSSDILSYIDQAMRNLLAISFCSSTSVLFSVKLILL